MKYAISYVSTVSTNLKETDIQHILEFSMNWNNDHAITGILLYSQGNFFQVLEGDKKLVTELFNRIKSDSRHYDLIKIFEKEIPHEKFEGYKADFVSLDSRFRGNEMERYFAQIETLSPSIQTPVKYILMNFSEGIN